MLFTVAEFKTVVGIPTAVTAHDDYVLLLAKAITAAVDKHCRRTLASAAHTEILDGSGTDSVLVRNPPVATSPAVVLYISGEQSWDAAHTVAASDYVIEQRTGRVRLKPTAVNPDLFPQDVARFQAGIQNVRVDYTGGYTPAAMPEDLKMGAIEWAAASFNRRKAQGLSNLSIGGVSVSPLLVAMPASAKKLVGSYRMPFRTGMIGAP
ncbi:MAG: hypothetical protein ACE5FA_00035 [Dehalococcoidia bacterium]